MIIDCLLCRSFSVVSILIDTTENEYFHCEICDLYFLNPKQRLKPEEEKKRYLEHNNDINDVRYQNFLKPLGDEIRKRFSSASTGLDYGAGTGPVLAEALKKEGYLISLYDPLFWPDKIVLENKYDFIFASEVAEHFFNPEAEFKRMKELLNPNGLMAIMTLLYDEKIDFKEWYYRRDPTHVVFYSQNTFRWIAKRLEISSPVFIGNRIVLLSVESKIK